MNHQYALVSLNISSQKNNEHSETRGVVTGLTTHDNIMPEFRMLAFKLWGGRVHPKTLKVFFSVQISYLKIFLNQCTVSKTVPKVVWKYFEINLKIN